MTDIVERLRDHNRHIRGRLIEGLTDLVIDDMVEAADEIERLREALRFYAKNHYPNIDDGPWGPNSNDWGDVARAALEEKE